MADSDAHTGMGALLQKESDTVSDDFISIMGIKSISGPNISRDTHDTTDMMSPLGWREFIGGLVDAGEISFDANWLPRDPTQGQDTGGLMAEFDKSSCASRGRWRIVAPECEGEADVYLQMSGILTGQNIEIPMDDLMAFTGTIKVSGRPELVIDGS